MKDFIKVTLFAIAFGVALSSIFIVLTLVYYLVKL